MDDILSDIRKKLENNSYQNEEHVRLSLVSRILLELGWDIWNPKEVDAEFKVVPNEDATRVDFALFLNQYQPPAIFIEIKYIGKIEIELHKIEQQLRDYNRNNTAQFSIITDGQKWRFYYSQTGGEFSQKCFKVFDLLKDDLNDIINTLNLYLSKEQIISGIANKEAGRLLQLNQKQRALEDSLSKARRLISEPPFPSLPQSIVELVLKSGFTITLEEAILFAEQNIERKPPQTDYPPNIIKSSQIERIKKTSKNKFPPDGTKCKFKYKDNTYEGLIENNRLNVFDHGSFTSFSAASGKLTNTSRNGWSDWFLQLSDTNSWILADNWRLKK